METVQFQFLSQSFDRNYFQLCYPVAIWCARYCLQYISCTEILDPSTTKQKTEYYSYSTKPDYEANDLSNIKLKGMALTIGIN